MTVGWTTTSDQCALRYRPPPRGRRAGQVDHHDVVTPPRRREGLADRAGIGLRTRTAPRPSTPSPARRGTRLTQRPPAEPARGGAQRVPADAGIAVESQHAVAARTERVEVDHDGRLRAAAATCPSEQASVVAPAPPEPPTTPRTIPSARPASSRSVSSSATSSDPAGSSTTRSAPSSERVAERARRPPVTTRPPGHRADATARARPPPRTRSAPTSTTGAALQARSTSSGRGHRLEQSLQRPPRAG